MLVEAPAAAIIESSPPQPPIAPRPAPAGKFAAPHRHEQEQAPPEVKVPLPMATDAAVEVAATAIALLVALDPIITAAALDAEPALDPVLAEVEVPFCAIAAAKNAAWDFVAVGLILNTIPLPQCPFCLQYIQIGVLTVTWNCNMGAGETVLLGLGMNPESKPPTVETQGCAKEDWVTVWFMDSKLNCTMSPTAALMLLGV